MSSSPVAGAGLDEFGYRQELHRALSTRDLVVFGMIFMVPNFPVTSSRAHP